MFWSKSFGKKALTTVAAWVENTVIYSVLEQVVWQEGFNHCYSMGRKRYNLQCFAGKWCSQKAGAIVKAWVENTVFYSVLEQVVCQEGLNHC